MHLPKSAVGRKLIMSVTGFSMIAFVVAHLLGNTSMYYGPDSINSYAKALHQNRLFFYGPSVSLCLPCFPCMSFMAHG